jgi:type II secretory pathway predicted ATPase ExeA
MQPNLLALYGLKFNPFAQDIPIEAVFVPPRLDHFCWRIENGLAREGGFAMVHGDPGCGKSVALRLLHQRLMRLPELMVGSIAHPQSRLSDFYRELSDLFAVPIKPQNRWGGFKALRERWLAHMEASRRRCVLLIDEAQEMTVPVLSELRLLAQARFDSQLLLCVVLAGDARLPEKFSREDLIPLGSRIRCRLALESASIEELQACLDHLLAAAGNASLMTVPLRQTLCEHAAGNYRILMNLAGELLAQAAQRELPQIDEKLYLETYTATQSRRARR